MYKTHGVVTLSPGTWNALFFNPERDESRMCAPRGVELGDKEVEAEPHLSYHMCCEYFS